jgi:hypothetical protein
VGSHLKTPSITPAEYRKGKLLCRCLLRQFLFASFVEIDQGEKEKGGHEHRIRLGHFSISEILHFTRIQNIQVPERLNVILAITEIESASLKWSDNKGKKKSENQTSSQRLLLAVALADVEAKPAVARLDTRANIVLVAPVLGDTLANTLSIFLGS